MEVLIPSVLSLLLIIVHKWFLNEDAINTFTIRTVNYIDKVGINV